MQLTFFRRYAVDAGMYITLLYDVGMGTSRAPFSHFSSAAQGDGLKENDREEKSKKSREKAGKIHANALYS
jgi:hypothetical protein